MPPFLLRCLYILPLLGLWACVTDDVDPVAQATIQNAIDIKAYIKTRADSSSFISSNSGLYYSIPTRIAGSKSPAVLDEVGYLRLVYNLKGTLLDSTYATKPAYAPFGIGYISPYGLDEALAYMRVGEKATVLLPSALAYGSASLTGLPAYSAVRFDIKLVSSRTESQQISNYIATKKLTVTDSSSTGLKIIKTTPNPMSNAVVTGQSVKVNYSGSLLNSTSPFDSGTFTIILGTTSVIAGFEEGVRKLKVGEKATILIPSAIGYGSKGTVNSSNQYVVPPYTPMVFTIEIVSAQ